MSQPTPQVARAELYDIYLAEKNSYEERTGENVDVSFDEWLELTQNRED